MTLQLSVAVRNGRLNSIPTSIGASAIIQIRSGSVPANCAAASTGTVLATVACPSTYFAAASAGAMALTGTWQDLTADNSGTAAHFRMFDSTTTTCHAQGTVGTSGTDMVVDSVTFTAGQAFTITSFTINDPNG